MKKYFLIIATALLLPISVYAQGVKSLAGFATHGRSWELTTKQVWEQTMKTNVPKSILFQRISIVSDIPFGVNILQANGASFPLDTFKDTLKNMAFLKNTAGLKKKVVLSEWAAPLQERFGQNKFAGYFAEDLSTVDALSGVAVEDTFSAEEALQRALLESQSYRQGYLLVAVQGNKYRAKDILVMDLANHRWISLNKSKGQALASYYTALIQSPEVSNFSIDNRQGLFAEMPEETGIVNFTTDGLDWHHAHPKSSLGQALLNNVEDYYLSYFPHEHKVRYAMDKNAPLLDSTDEVDLYRDGSAAGLDVEVIDYHPVLLFKQEFVPNILLEVNGKWVPAGGEIVGENIPSTASDLAFARDVMKLSLIKRGQTVVIKRPLPTENYLPGSIHQYIVTAQ